MTTGYTLGLDLGPPGEPTALAVVQWSTPELGAKPAYVLRHLERFGLGAPFTEIVPAVGAIAAAPALAQAPLVVDYTGVGRAFVTTLRPAVAPRHVVPVAVTAGLASGENGGD